MSRKWFGLLLLLPTLGGCGLAEYEGRMARAKEKQARWEEANRLLDRPLAVPSRQENGAPVPLGTLFLRPPKGISDLPDKAPRGGLLYTYRPRALPQGGAIASAGPFLFVELAISTGQKDFAGDVLRIFSPQDRPTTTQNTVQTALREETFNTTEFDEAGRRVSVNFTTLEGGKPVAIVYWVAPGQQAASTRAVRVSLESFGSGADVGPLQTILLEGPWKTPAMPAR